MYNGIIVTILPLMGGTSLFIRWEWILEHCMVDIRAFIIYVINIYLSSMNKILDDVLQAVGFYLFYGLFLPSTKDVSLEAHSWMLLEV